VSAIEWTGSTLNPSTGCDKVSPGCDRCYALTLAGRLKAMGQPKYQADGDSRTSGPGFGFTMHPRVMGAALRRKKPTVYFVNSMSDLFHAHATREFLAGVFAVMAATPQHTYQCLTKRPLRMGRILNDPAFHRLVMVEGHRAKWGWPNGIEFMGAQWPLPGVWLGTSVEDQQRADERIPHLRATPAAVRFLSVEPLLAPVDLSGHLDGIGWVIIGGESGPGARPMLEGWAVDIVQQCQAAQVPVFCKQLGTVLGGRRHHDINYFPPALQVREYPQAVTP